MPRQPKSILAPVLAGLLAGCGLLCPGDRPHAPASADTSFGTLAACEAARPTATCAPLITNPDAACVAHCRSGFLGAFCVARVTNASFVVGEACFPVDTAPPTYAYRCVKTATCSCV